MPIHHAKGKTFVATESDEELNVRAVAGNKIMLDNGERVQIRRAGSNGTAIAQSQTDSVIIAAPADALTYYVVIYLCIMCDADTAVTFNSKGSGAGVAINGPWPIASKGGFVKPDKPRGYFRCVAGEALTMTTGAGGNTSYEIDYIEVPINVDIL
jgi:hypothetical protein